MLPTHEQFMQRCLQLAKLAEGNVAPNPMVGSVLVHEGIIIGEGYHQKYGEAHAEVNCINSVSHEQRHLISHSILYVSLEPCAHFGKTPPCADLIIKHKIPQVVIGCRDPFLEVNGKGIEKLRDAGVHVITGVLEEECKAINKRFFIFHTKHRPYVVLKWAQTGDGKIAGLPLAPSNSPQGEESPAHGQLKQNTDSNEKDTWLSQPLQPGKAPSIGGGLGEADPASRLFITSPQTNRLVHQWRSQEAAILVGTNTAMMDDPELTARLWPGNNPMRILIDMHLRLPKSLKLFDGSTPTIVFNLHQHTLPLEKVAPSQINGVAYYQVTEDVSLVHQMLNALCQLHIQSLLVEGGSFLLQSFIEEGIWDEARVITNEALIVGDGLPAPVLTKHQLKHREKISSDVIHTYSPIGNE